MTGGGATTSREDASSSRGDDEAFRAEARRAPRGGGGEDARSGAWSSEEAMPRGGGARVRRRGRARSRLRSGADATRWDDVGALFRSHECLRVAKRRARRTHVRLSGRRGFPLFGEDAFIEYWMSLQCFVRMKV